MLRIATTNSDIIHLVIFNHSFHNGFIDFDLIERRLLANLFKPSSAGYGEILIIRFYGVVQSLEQVIDPFSTLARFKEYSDNL